MSQYDALGSERYRESKLLAFRTYSEVPDHLALLGDVRGRDVLDLACGEGFYTRLIRAAGARRVVGVDLSTDMIALAREQEAADPQGIDYIVADGANLPRLAPPFQIASAAYLFNYASTPGVLTAMARGAYEALEPGGRLVATHCEMWRHPRADYRPYGFTTCFDSPAIREGSSFAITFHLDGGRDTTIRNYIYSRETLAGCLDSVGFHDIAWCPPSVTPAGLDALGAAYWKCYLENPPVIRFTCVK
jgi:SAM-dependent methyltransferase